jgi:poly-gamma-glutamate synthesis protein (capsule biosynthesis protein)
MKILLTGDFCPINRVEELARKQEFEPLLSDFMDLFRESDLNVIDLECPLTLSETARRKTGPHQKAHPDSIKILKHAGIHLAAMANNHIMDYGRKGVQETLERCRESGIETVGIGASPEDARLPYSSCIDGKNLAILNYADNEFLSAPDGSFHCNPLDPVSCANDIAAAREAHDYLIVIVHAGNEFYELPSPRTKRLYRSIIDMGADVVVSHHTHAFSGYETYKGKPIFYGLGNFMYDWPGKIDQGWNRGYVVRLLISDKIGFEIVALKQCGEKPGVFRLNELEQEAFQKEISRLNQIIADDRQLEASFQEYCQKVFPMYDAFLEPYFGRGVTALRKRGLFPKLLSRRKRLLYLNLIRCESHREVLLRLLKENE